MKKVSIPLLFVLLPFSLLNAQQVIDSLALELNAIITTSGIPGMGVCIASDEGILYVGGAGFRDKEQKRPYDSLSIQNVASISKTMIGLSLMKLVEQGKLQLDMDINELLPFKVINPRFPKHKITVFHLATHTSGITDTYKAESAGYFIIDRTAKKKNYDKSFFKDYQRYLKSERIPYSDYLQLYLSIDGKKFQKNIFGKYKPGEDYSYSNIGATLAAYIVEQVSGQSFETFTQQHIFEPLEMKNTSWDKAAISSPNLAQSYFLNGSKVPEYTNIFSPSSNLHTNSYEMGLFMVEILKGYRGNGHLLTQESYNYLLSNHLNLSTPNASRGIFWYANKAGTNFGHEGSNFGIRCGLYFNPKLNRGIFVMLNVSSFGNPELSKNYRGILEILSRYAKRLY